jgi:hypothetical protein
MNIKLRYSIGFPAAVWFDQALLVVNYSLTINLLTQSLDPTEQNIALDRIKHFIFNEMHSTVFVNQADEEQAEAFYSLGLNVTTLPQEPVDQIVGIALYYKLNAIMQGRMKITELVFCSDAGDNVEYSHSENDALNIFPAQGWWLSAGLDHCDLTPDDDEEQEELSVDEQWQELELSWIQANAEPDLSQIVFANLEQNQNETKH